MIIVVDMVIVKGKKNFFKVFFNRVMGRNIIIMEKVVVDIVRLIFLVLILVVCLGGFFVLMWWVMFFIFIMVLFIIMLIINVRVNRVRVFRLKFNVVIMMKVFSKERGMAIVEIRVV